LCRARSRFRILAENLGNKAQVTMSPEDVDALFAALDKTPKHKLGEKYSIATSLNLIDQNWGVDMTTFPPPDHGRDFRPSGECSSWDTRLLATLATLSEFTPGQGAYMGSLLGTAVEARNMDKKLKQGWILREIDIKRVVKDLLHPLRGPAAVEPELVRKKKTTYGNKKKKAAKKAAAGGEMDMDDALEDIIMDGVEDELEVAGLLEDAEGSEMEE
jgi:hypothetical protein